ncbi:MAG: acyltransferase [Bacteroidetes bacterium]|nr:acyltransferase [Bacteroidota bacterium]MBK9525445.1 acyltransferase [Bacteroidota bacterium]MBK9542280.1 acyltransferase [Bacteroidota bacterium]MBP6403808.1 acyltransferase [Bacteroidia bacterium]MBP6648874.1 acyltransferase [Bacteroidia bacterium]
MKKRIFFQNLDGIRFFCFLSVFLCHSFYTENPSIVGSGIYHFIKITLFGNGNIGVNAFFVLSGFLITYLLIEEKKINGQVSPPKFWIRRILRIWPLYYFCVLFGFVLFPFLKQMFGQTANESANPIYYLTFLANFDIIHHGLPDSSTLGLLWSIAIEEQFYFLWPIVIYSFPVNRLWIPFVTIILSSLIFRAFNPVPVVYEIHTLSAISDMTIGAVAAWLIHTSSGFREFVKNLTKPNIAFIYFLFIVIYLFRLPLLKEIFAIRIFDRLIVSIVLVFILLEQTYSENSFFKLSNLKTISGLGVITYGLYCFHFVGILIALTITRLFGINNHLWQVLVLETILGLAITIGISKLSYVYFEKYFLNLKEKFSFITK